MILSIIKKVVKFVPNKLIAINNNVTKVTGATGVAKDQI